MLKLALAPAQTMPWRDWYSLQRWRKRAKHQLRLEPLCRICLEHGLVSPATIADHIEPHGGDWNKFLLGPPRYWLPRAKRDGTLGTARLAAPP
jgi:hypothetical protein